VCEIKVEITQVAAVIECPHPDIVLQYIREQQEDTKELLTSDDMLRGESKVEGKGTSAPDGE